MHAILPQALSLSKGEARVGSCARWHDAARVSATAFALALGLGAWATGTGAEPAPAAPESAPAVAQAPYALAPVERPPEDELVLELRFGRYVLSDGMIGYLSRGGLLLPLGGLADALEFAVVVDPAAGRADGWFIREHRLFFLDLARGEATVEGRKTTFPRALVEAHADDIYVDTALLADWFPIDLDFDLSQLSVEVASREPLPIEERLEREKAYAGLGRGRPARPQYPRLDLPHRLLDWPAVETSSSVGYDGGREGGVAADYNALIAGDFLYADGTLFLAGDDVEALSDARFTLARKDPDAGLFGPLRATEAAAGDVFTPQLPLTADQQEGRGVALSSFPLSRPSEFDRTTLRGDLPLGWEVELYRNEVLLDIRRPTPEGRYEFADVPLLFGLNVLRLVFYGPQGQRRDETQRLFVGPGQVRPGEQHFRVAVNQQDEDTIPVGDDAAADELQGEMRYVGEYELGVTQEVSLAAGVASLPLDDGRHSYAGLGLRASALGSFLRADVVRDFAGGTAAQVAVQTDLFGVNVLAEHARFFDFVSERAEADSDPVESATRLRIDGVVPEWLLPRLPFSLTAEVETRESGRTETTAQNRLSAFFGGVAVSNNLNFRLSGGGGVASTSTLDGSLFVSGRLDGLALRGQVGYAVDPVTEFTNVELTADYAIDDDTTARVGVNRQLTGDHVTSFLAGAFRAFDRFALGFSGAYSDDGAFSAGLSLSVGFGREPRSGGVALRPRGLATNGAVSARVFLDRDQDGTYGPGDEPLPEVRFHGHEDIETDADGVAFVTGLSAYQPRSVAIDPGSLADPYWVPVRDGVEVVSRPGKTALVDFPVTTSGEIDGTVFLRRGETLTEIANVQLQLVNASGEVVAETKSAFDGFYLFQFVRPGRYAVRVAPEQVERLRLLPPPPAEAEIGPDGDVVAGLDLVLERAARPEDAPGAAEDR